MSGLVMFAPLEGPWLHLLVEGWRLSSASLGHHGRWSVLLWRFE